MTTVKVSNVSLGATDGELKEFFSFSGDILYLETQSETERSKLAYVTFKDLQGAEIAVLLSGATIGDSSVIVTMAPDYELSLEALASLEPKESPKSPKGNESVLRKAEDVVSSMLAKGFILGKDAIAKAKSLDEKHQLTSTASAKVASLDKKEEDLSEEELKQEVQLYVTRVQDSDQKLQNAALEKFRKRIPESDSPFHTVPETLEFLRPHYATLKNVLKEMNDSTNYLSEILAVLDLGEGEKAPYLDEVDWPELGGKSITDLSKKDLMVELVKHGLGTTKQGKQSAMELRLAVSIRMKENGYFGELRGKPIPELVEAELKSELRLRLLSVTGSKDELLLRLAKAVNHGIEITEDEKSPATSLAATKEIKRRDYPLAFLDLEFKQCTILEVGIILVDPKTWNGEKYNATIRQSKEFMKSYVGRPNLPTKYLEDNVSPRFRDVHETIFDCLNGKIVVGHNIHGCDLSRIRDRCFDLDLDAPKPRGVIDTYKWMKDNTLRSLYPELKLADLAVQFELGEQSHRAAEDCLLNIEVFKRVLASKNLFEILETIEGENTEKSDNTRKKRRAG